MSNLKKEALEYHATGRKGKIEVVSTKPCATQRELALAYTPGVAHPCLEIEKNPELAYEYTAKGNLVAVLSNGTAVLGLGDIGALAGKPVMEGKGILFKRFADIDVFDIEVKSHDAQEVIKVCELLEPTFGGINLEDIKAPECFIIEETLKRTMNIPVFHDDQHGTAIISGAALLNALEIVGKRIGEARIVVNGAGAAGVACATHYIALGAKRENIVMCDTTGVIYEGRTKGMNPYKQRFATTRRCRTLAEAMEGADVACGLSAKGAFTGEMIRSLAKNPIVFAMANPDPEITPEDAHAVRDDVIIATGRSDYPNQVNNVLGFPFIFRGALDTRATQINEPMKLAATMALARLAKEDVPDYVCKAYGVDKLEFGRDYIIPKPFDRRVFIWESAAVAKAAMDSGVARVTLDIEKYKERLELSLGRSREIISPIYHKAAKDPKRIVFAEGVEEKILKAAKIAVERRIATPILLGAEREIREKAKAIDIDLAGVEIIDIATHANLAKYVEELYRLRCRRGVTMTEAAQLLRSRNVFGSIMVQTGDADGMISGLTRHYPDVIRPALQVVKLKKGVKRVSGLYVLIFKKNVYFLADTTVNLDPTAEELAECAIEAAKVARMFDVEPRVAMLSYSNFGSNRDPQVTKMRTATELIRRLEPGLVVEGEMQANTAVDPEVAKRDYPFSAIRGDANVLIFPNLEAGNIAYKLLATIGGAELLGPVLMGMGRSVHVLQRGCSVNEIVDMTAVAVANAQELEG